MARMISPGGKVIIGRRTANWVWGTFETVLPVGEEQMEMDTRIADGLVYRPDDRRAGRFDLTWVRADVRIDMNAAKSDLEATLDQASRRTEGGIFYTAEISGPGLGRSVPGRDYRVGDWAEILMWGLVLDLMVTEIRLLSTRDDPLGVAVRVGGQPLQDPESQRKRVSDLHTQIMTERRRGILEAQRLQEQAATDRGQTQQIEAQTTTLRGQTSQLRDHSAQITDWTKSMNQNYELLKDLFRELALQSTMWDLVASLIERDHQNSGALRTFTDESQAAIAGLIAQLGTLTTPPTPPVITTD